VRLHSSRRLGDSADEVYTRSAVHRFSSVALATPTKRSRASDRKNPDDLRYTCTRWRANLSRKRQERLFAHRVRGLNPIRENIPEATWQHVWAFRRLYECGEYKAEEHGIEAVQVDPRNTSKRGSTCGFTRDHNRDGESFEC